MRRAAAGAAALAVLLASAGCTEAINGQATSEAAAFPTDIHGLGARLVHGNRSIKSAHLELVESAGGQKITGSGDERLNNGKVGAIDLSETAGTNSLRFVIIGSQVFAQLPPTIYPASKPWVEISPDTTNTELKQLYNSFQTSIQTGAGATVRAFVEAGRNLRLRGVERFDGVRVAHYTMTVDIASLPGNFVGRDALEQSGLARIPVQLYVDAQGRPRKVTENLTVLNQHVTVRVTLTKIDQPVQISPPPPDQVEHA